MCVVVSYCFLYIFINNGYIDIGPGKEQQADQRKPVKLTPYDKR